LVDLQYFIKYICKNKRSVTDSLSNGNIINIGRKLKKIRTKYIERGSRIIIPLCQIIADYTDNSHFESYATFQNDEIIKLYLYLDNNFRSMSGTGGLGIDHCYQFQKNNY
jgi:hypothetical protein